MSGQAKILTSNEWARKILNESKINCKQLKNRKKNTMEIDNKKWVKVRAWIRIHHRELYDTYQKEKKYGTKDAQKAMAKMVKLYEGKVRTIISDNWGSKKGEWRGGGRKKLPVEEKGVQTSFYLKPHQVAIVREFVEKLREEEKRQNSISKQA